MVNKYVKQIILPFYRLWNDIKWQQYKRSHKDINLVIGAANLGEDEWFKTDILILDVTNEKQFRHFFSERKIRRVLAEHVLEHLTTEQIDQMLVNILKYSTPDVRIRIAVPDGNHANPLYIEGAKPGGTGAGADDHKHLFTYQSLSNIFSRHGFKAHLVEYWDENKEFHTVYKDDENGLIRRSYVNDPRRKDDVPYYTSLIIDFTR